MCVCVFIKSGGGTAEAFRAAHCLPADHNMTVGISGAQIRNKLNNGTDTQQQCTALRMPVDGSTSSELKDAEKNQVCSDGHERVLCS